jgi:xanthine dehydrogenase accessory factor
VEATQAQAQRWLDAGVPGLVVEIVEAVGSTPREVGTRMLVSARETVGTIGGGRLELEAIALARQHVGRELPSPVRFSLGPALGQCCGGAVTLRFLPLNTDWPTPKCLFSLALFGAGHVGYAVARICATLPCRVWWFDERESAFSHYAWPAHINCVSVEAVVGEVASLPSNSVALVLTHSHALDLELVEALLRRADMPFVGLIGSQAKRARFVRHLVAKGVETQRLVCPIGQVGSKVPEAIAVTAVAQLLALGT